MIVYEHYQKHGSSLAMTIKHGWIEEMTSHVKSIDGNHILEAGLEGFYGEYKNEINPGFSMGTNFITNNQIKEIDFATVHSYPDIR